MCDVFLVDATFVGVFKRWSSLDSASDWTQAVEFGFHFINAHNEEGQMCDIVLSVVNSPAFVEACLTYRTWWPGAVSAVIHWFTLLMFCAKVVGFVLLARRVWNTLIVTKFKNHGRISSIAVTATCTAYHDLGV